MKSVLNFAPQESNSYCQNEKLFLKISLNLYLIHFLTEKNSSLERLTQQKSTAYANNIKCTSDSIIFVSICFLIITLYGNR